MFSKLTFFFILTIARYCTFNSAMAIQIEKVADYRVVFGEGPHWDVKSQKLYYVDIDGQKILRYDPATGSTTSASIKDGPVSIVIPVEGTKDKLLAGVNRDVVVVTWDGESNIDNPPMKKLTTVDSDRNETRTNDGKCDPAGRFWIGTVGLPVNGTVPTGKAALYLIGKDNVPQKKYSPVTTSNGLTWSLQNDVMYYIDTPTFQVWAFDYNNADGSISNKRVLFDLQANGIFGRPDGMTIDTDGNLWVALSNGKAVLQIDPKNSKLLRKIDMPVTKTTSLTFGGPQLDILYVTTGRDNETADSGSVFSIKGLGVKGRPANDFKYLIQ